jgi:hypothetical protein
MEEYFLTAFPYRWYSGPTFFLMQDRFSRNGGQGAISTAGHLAAVRTVALLQHNRIEPQVYAA